MGRLFAKMHSFLSYLENTIQYDFLTPHIPNEPKHSPPVTNVSTLFSKFPFN